MTRVLPSLAARARIRLAIVLAVALASLAAPVGGAHAATEAKQAKAPTSHAAKQSASDAKGSQPTKPLTPVKPIAPAKVETPGTSIFDDIKSFLLTWGPLLFMGMITVAIFMTLRFMPRTK